MLEGVKKLLFSNLYSNLTCEDKDRVLHYLNIKKRRINKLGLFKLSMFFQFDNYRFLRELEFSYGNRFNIFNPVIINTLNSIRNRCAHSHQGDIIYESNESEAFFVYWTVRVSIPCRE